MIVRAVILGKPVPKGRPRVYHHDRHGRELARPRTVTPEKTLAAEEAIRLSILSQNPGLQPTDKPVSVELRFSGVGRGDLDNFIKTVLDAANGIVWKDDRQVRHIEAWMWKDYDPRTEFDVTEMLA